ncbi:MAG: ATP-binding cassette domain-containing protein [Humibacillus sp.]|nr:ATP-binding cassette domain-containing protein [Humibacillus sp.]MDN5779359.1 ATP-binding cassette domain-containing protein [Humibacillus sp.]
MIELSGVTKTYDGQAVLTEVDVTIPRGRLTALVGPNGAGKSTLFGIASRLIVADAGHVTVDDLDIARARNEEVARRLAVLRQDNTLAARLSVADLVRFGRFPHSKGRLTADDHRIVAAAIAELELEPFRDRFLDQLSGGQRQRAFIAMVLAQDTDYVLLDEPLNNLDLRHSVQMMRRLRSLVDDHAKTIALVLHDVNFASAHADHIVALRDGIVVAQGPPEQIITPEVLSEVYEVDVSVLDHDGQRVAVYFR